MDGRHGRGFGAMLRAVRVDRGLTQEDLAEAAGLSVRAVGELERGRAVPHRDTVGRLSAALQLDEESQRRLTALARIGWASQRRAGAPPTEPTPAIQPPVTERSPSAPPAQLPRDMPDFVGRDRELERLVESARHHGGIWVIDGLGGAGKTALAVRFGHRVADRFPDGHLYLDLRGFDLDQPPVAPVAALSYFLRALGADTRRLPTGLDELAAMFRSALAGKRVLIVLDNAASTEQSRELLPGAAGCLVLVTSRHRLSGLAARHGARRITLGSLDPASAVALLTSITGAELARREPGALDDLARLCGFLPLALRIAAERARTETTSLNSQVAGLADERRRLDLLTTDDEGTSVRVVFSWSYRALEPAAARLFRLLGLHPGPDFTVPVAAALADEDVHKARRLVDLLADAHLIERSGPDRYRCHDLMRAYAAERARADEPAAQIEAAARRLIRWHLAAAVTANRLISPQRYLPGLDDVAAEPGPPPMRTYGDAVAWCDAELDNLVAVARLASAATEHALTWRLAWALAGYLDLRRPWNAWLTTHRIGLESARQARDKLGEAAILTSLGLAYYYPRLFAEAEDCDRRALHLWRELGDRRGEAVILNAIANIHLETRDFDQAIEHYRQALALHRAVSDRRGEGVTLSNLAETYCELGRFDEVLEYAPAALHAARETGNQRARVLSLCQLARAIAATRGIAEAETHFREAVELAHEADDQHVEAWALDYLGTAMLQAGRPADAALSWRRATALFDALHDPQAISLHLRLTALS
ncbi:MAG TPA: tetratricopeptide repeat protein [Streptosporangiaceae bacterium]|nr:tetratricopeptide repeat protein [Streptosporangiaceae bacterium]